VKQPGRDQLLLSSPDLQTRLGRKFVDETELLPLMLAHGLVRRVRTIQIYVRPLGGDSFKVALEASEPTVGEAKVEIARSHGTAEDQQELYRVAERADGSAVREDDAEPEPLEDEHIALEDGDVIAMAVKVTSVTEFADSSLATVHDCQLLACICRCCLLVCYWFTLPHHLPALSFFTLILNTLNCVLDQSADVGSLCFVFVLPFDPFTRSQRCCGEHFLRTLLF
jgi:hypothetical protein